MGCFLNGCCFGKITSHALGLVFPRGGAVWRHQQELQLLSNATAAAHPVHPTQLYSALSNLVIFFLLYFYLRPRKRFDGQVFAWFCILYSLSRSFIEIYRDDDRGVLWGWLSTSQIISLPLLGLAIYLLWRLHRETKERLIPEEEIYLEEATAPPPATRP
jgi:phosphatidylglycerol:prolipoprotein diacylglycerol transferase